MMRKQLVEQDKRLAALEAHESARESNPTASVDSGPVVEHGDGLQAVVSGVPIRLTGFIKGDMLWNNSRVDSTSAPRRSAPGNQGNSDDQFTATVQHSRVAATVGPIPVANSTLGGYVELDYFNLSDSGDTNFINNQLRVRDLYMNVAHEDWTILVGQTWDLISPLNPTSLNTNGNYWFGGNAGFRRPQLQVTRRIEWAEDSPLTLKGSINANVGRTTMPGGITYDSGRKAGWPVFQAAIEQGLGGFGAGPIRMGIAGGYGQEDLVGVKKPHRSVGDRGLPENADTRVAHADGRDPARRKHGRVLHGRWHKRRGWLDRIDQRLATGDLHSARSLGIQRALRIRRPQGRKCR